MEKARITDKWHQNGGVQPYINIFLEGLGVDLDDVSVEDVTGQNNPPGVPNGVEIEVIAPTSIMDSIEADTDNFYIDWRQPHAP